MGHFVLQAGDEAKKPTPVAAARDALTTLQGLAEDAADRMRPGDSRDAGGTCKRQGFATSDDRQNFENMYVQLVLGDGNWVAALSAGGFGFITAVLLALTGLPEASQE